MRVVDTSAWLEWIRKTPTGLRVQPELPPDHAWVVPTIVQYELARWLAREISESVAAQIIAFSNQLVIMPLDTDLATKAADYAGKCSLATADAIIYATAMDAGADLLTCDARFANLPRVVYIPKLTP